MPAPILYFSIATGKATQIIFDEDGLSMAGKREQQKVNRREQILKAAIDLFTKNGFEETTVENITATSGIAKGTFFNFFSKKEDVLLYFLDKEISKSDIEIERKIGSCETFAQQLELLMATYMKHIFPNKDLSKVLLRERVVKIGTGTNTNERSLMKTLSRLVEAAQQRGELKKDLNPGRTASMIFAIYTMYVIYWTNGFIKTKAEVVLRVREVLSHVLYGIAQQNP